MGGVKLGLQDVHVPETEVIKQSEDVSSRELTYCVYTTLIDDYEILNEQPVAKQSAIPFICLTDNPTLRSDTWQCQVVDQVLPLDPIRSQRDIKIRPHRWLPNFSRSIYIDNSIILKVAPERIFSLMDWTVGFLALRHSFRETVLDEFLEVSRLGYDDNNRLFEQLNHYLMSSPKTLEGPCLASGLMVRDHCNAKVIDACEMWAAHVMRYSRRDQLSISHALAMAKLEPVILDIDLFESEFHRWPVVANRARNRGYRDVANSLMPVSAKVRVLEQSLSDAQKQFESAKAATEEFTPKLASAQAALDECQQQLADYQQQIVSCRADTDVLRQQLAVTQARLVDHERALELVYSSRSWRLSLPFRLVSESLRVALRTVHSAVVGLRPCRAVTSNNRVIFVQRNDLRGQYLIEKRGNLNPSNLDLWQMLLNRGDWNAIVDVGANYGEMLVNVDLPASADVIAIEPNPRVANLLRRTLRKAGISAQVMQVALSEREGNGRLMVPADYSGTARLAGADDLGTKVKLLTLAQIMGRFGKPLPKLRLAIKIDVEGHEISILRGSLEEISRLDDFAALIEIVHLSAEDMAWITDQFQVGLLKFGEPLQIAPARGDELQEHLRSGLFYSHDVVLTRKDRKTI